MYGIEEEDKLVPEDAAPVMLAPDMDDHQVRCRLPHLNMELWDNIQYPLSCP
jgi:hypothetical protein